MLAACVHGSLLSCLVCHDGHFSLSSTKVSSFLEVGSLRVWFVWPGVRALAATYFFLRGTITLVRRSLSDRPRPWFPLGFLKVFGLNQVPFMAGFTPTQKQLLAKAMEVLPVG